MLTRENFDRGVLIDEQLMAGVTRDRGNPANYVAFVLDYLSGEYLGHKQFEGLEPALGAINSIKRDWRYEASGGCGSGSCGADGNCSKGSCARESSMLL